MSLLNFRLVALPKTLVIRKTTEQSEQLQEAIDAARKMDFTIVESDSLFYANDSSGRSIVYLYNNNKVVYTTHLKGFNPKTIPELLDSIGYSANDNLGPSVLKNSEIVFHLKEVKPKTISTVSDTIKSSTPKKTYAIRDAVFGSNYIYAHGRKSSEIFRIDGQTFNLIDTINLESDTIENDIYKAFYGVHYESSRYKVNSFFRSQNLPMEKNRYSKPYVHNDTIYIICSIPVISQTPDPVEGTIYRVDNYNCLIVLNEKGNVIKVSKMQADVPENVYGEAYYFYTLSLFMFSNKFYVPIGKEELTDKNYVFIEASTKGDSTAISNGVNIKLPDFNLESSLGYNLIDYVAKDKYVVFKRDRIICDVVSGKTYNLPFQLAKNHYTREVLESMKINDSSLVLDLAVNSNAILCLYKNLDSLKLATMEIQKGKIILKKNEIIFSKFPTEDYRSSALVSLYNGFIVGYNIKEKRFAKIGKINQSVLR